MRVSCPHCLSTYEVAAEKIPAAGARARCPKCGDHMIIGGHAGSAAAALAPASSHPDYGRTFAYDFQAVDQSLTDASYLLKEAAGDAPFLAAGESYWLEDSSGGSFSITRAEVVVGRSGADINLTDPEVSRRHCLLKVYGGYAVLSDLESTNGTYFEGRKILTARVPVGGVFSVGKTSLRLLAGPERGGG